MMDDSLSDSVVADTQVTYHVIAGGTKQGRDKLVDSAGYSYTVKTHRDLLQTACGMGSLVNISGCEDDWRRAQAVYWSGVLAGRDEPLPFVAHLFKVHAEYCQQCIAAEGLAGKKAEEILPQSETPTQCDTPMLDDIPACEETLVHGKITYTYRDPMIDQDTDPMIDHSYCHQRDSCNVGKHIECTPLMKKYSVITKDVVRPIYLVKSLVTATEPMTAQSLLAENIPPMSSTGHSLLRNIPAIPNIEQKTHTGRAVAIMSSSVNTAVLTDHSLQDEKQHNLFCKNTPLTTVTHFHMDGSDRIEIKSLLDEDIPPVPSTCHPPLQNIPAIPNTEQKTRRAVDILPGSVTAPLTDHSLQEEKQGQLFSNPSPQTFPTEDGDTSLRNELALYNNFELFKLEPVGDQKCLLKRVVNQDMRVQFKNAYGNFISAKTNIFSENEIDQTADIEQIVDAKDTLSDVIINYSVETETTASPPTTNTFDVNAIPLSEEVSKPVSCPYCLETFRHDQSFNDHLYLHISDAAYKDTVKCEVCGKRNDSRIALLEHMHVHTNFKLYACTVCSKKFAYGQSFKDHMRIHSGRKNMKCSLCGEFFNTYYNLRHHRRTQHGLEKVICKKTQKICEYCGRQFKWRSTLLSHYNSHSEIPKSHLCSVCGKGFATAHSLSNHCGKHRAESKPKQPSVCHICGSSFTNRGGLYQHMKKVHNDMKS